jgi:hypothetical protein
MSTSLSPMPKFIAFTDAGLPLVGGKLYTYIAGTATPKATYTDNTGDTANTNPVILDAAGRANVWLSSGLYKFIMKDSTDAIIWTVDNIGNNNLGTQIVSTISSLRALEAGSSESAFILGHTSAGDGGQGYFFWDSTNTDSDDNGVIINPTSYTGNGRWKRLIDGYVTPKMYGAVGNGAIDDNAAVFAANDYAHDNSVYLKIVDGNFLITGTNLTAKIIFEATGLLRWSTAINPTINCSISDSFKHFDVDDSANAPALSGMIEVLPEWFGAVGDGSQATNTHGTDDTLAIQVAVYSCSQGMWVVFNSSKKYFTDGIICKEGVNIKGSQPMEDDSESAPATDYKSNIHYTGISGAVFALANSGTGNLRGICVRDLVIDGGDVALQGLKLETIGSTVENCTIRNCLYDAGYGTGIYFNGSGSRNEVRNCNIYHCYYGIKAETSQINGRISHNIIKKTITGIQLVDADDWIVESNKISSFSGIGILTDGADCKIIDNSVTDLLLGTTIGINHSIGEGDNDISGNYLAIYDGTSPDGAIAIQVSSTAESGITRISLCNNVCYSQYGTNTTAIKTVVGNGATHQIEGDIFDNHISGYWAAEYDLADAYLTALRYQDNGLNVYRGRFGNTALIKTADSTSPLASINDTDVGAVAGNNKIIQIAGGVIASTSVWDRNFLTRFSTSDSWTGARVHMGIGLDSSNLTPRTDTMSWYERDPNLGKHSFGHLASELATIEAISAQSGYTGLLTVNKLVCTNLNFGGNNVTLGDKVTYPIKTSGLTVEQTGDMYYQELLNTITITFPTLYGAGTTTNFSIVSNYTTTSSTSNDIKTNGNTVVFQVPAGLIVRNGTGVKVRAYQTSTPSNYMDCTITSYTGTTLTLLVTGNGGSGSAITAWTILFKEFPFQPLSTTNTFQCTVREVISQNDLNNNGIFTMTYDGFSFFPLSQGEVQYYESNFNGHGSYGIPGQTVLIMT